MMEVYIQDLALTIPLVCLFLFSLFPIILKVSNGNTESKPLITFVLAVAAIAITGLAIGVRTTTEVTFAFENAITYSPMIKLASAMLILIGMMTVLLSYKHPAIPRNQYSEHVFLLLSAMIGMLVLMYANDLILVFVGIELLSLPLYVLIGIGGNALIPKESSFKYFVLGSFASAFLLFGIAFIYGAAQTTDIQQIVNNKDHIHQSFLMLGVLIFLVGLFFKVALVPFHAWLPDVYQGAPTPITAFMATAVKLVIFVFLIQFLPVMRLVESDVLMRALQWIAILTMFFGNLIAIKQSNFKRMLAYSSISHSGYLFLGIIAGFAGVEQSHIQGIFFYLLAYIFMTMGSFAIICLFESKEGQDLSLDHLKGLSKTHPWTAFALSIFLLSLAGIPPLGGFFAKLFLFSSALEGEQFWLVIWAVMSSVIGVYYYLRPVVYMYMKEKEIHDEFHQNDSVPTLATVYFCLIMIIILGLASQPFISKILKAI